MTEPRIDPEDLRRYAARWRVINEVEIAQTRATPVDVKLRQLDALRGFLDRLDRWRELEQQEDEAARDRWIRLREALSG